MLALVAVGAVACGGGDGGGGDGGGDDGGRDGAADGSAAPPARPPPSDSAAPALGRNVTLVTRDRIRIAGSYAAPPGDGAAPGVVLLHQLGSDRADWAGFAPPLRRAGYATLAIDLRGMGRSLSRSPTKERYAPPQDRRRYVRSMAADVEAAVSFLRRRPEVDPSRVAVAGLGGGANLAWRASGLRGVRGAVAIGPALSREELGAPRDADARPRGVLFVAPRLQAALSHELAGTTARPKRVSLALGEVAGAALLADERVEEEVLAWLARLTRAASERESAAPAAS